MTNDFILNGLDDHAITVHAIQDLYKTKKLTARDLILYYLDRISKYDQSGPQINAVLEINPEALHIAEALDFEYRQKGPRSPLHGIPVIIKDNIDTADKMHTSAGSLALKDSYPLKDADIVRQLRNAGAIILGKANLTEFANFMTENMPNGYSSRGGQVLNPYGPGIFDVGGSSSGSAAAVAANLTLLAIGTETCGSILSPASQNSVVGIKPTVGLVSRSGIIPISHSQDTAGPMARTVTDAALLLSAISGQDPKDPITLGREEEPIDYTRFLNPQGLKNARIGVPRAFYKGLEKDKISLMNEAIKKMKDLGATIIDPITLPSEARDWDFDVLTYEFKADMNAYLKGLSPSTSIKTLEDIIAFNENHPDACLKYGQTILIQSEDTSGTLKDPTYIKSLSEGLFHSQTNGIDYVLEKHHLDALLLPNTNGCHVAAIAGYPSITVPGGYTSKGEPLGITLTSTAYSEGKLIQLAYSYEQHTKHRQSPKL